MTKLNQIIAVEKGVQAKAKRDFTEVHRQSQQLDRLSGLERTYAPRDEEGERLPPESVRVQVAVDALNRRVTSTLTRLFDVVATKDYANTEAVADVIVDGVLLVPSAPVPYLLFLEKQLVDLRTYVDKLPTLDPAFTWHADPTSGDGVYRSEPVTTTRTKKVLKALELSPATDKHPAQVTTFTEDVIIGDWTKIQSSGAVPEARRQELIGRVDKLAAAVKYAREEANSIEVTDVRVGEAIFEYLFD